MSTFSSSRRRDARGRSGGARGLATCAFGAAVLIALVYCDPGSPKYRPDMVSQTGGAPAPAPGTQGAPVPGVGTGGSFGPSYVAVTGGGPFPDTSGAPTCSDAACLVSSARIASPTPVLVAAGAVIQITAPIHVARSILGAGSPQPTIQMTTPSCGAEATCAILQLEPGFSGWIYGLHLVGTYAGGTPGEWAHGIDIGAVNGVTIKGNLVENVQGDCFGTDYASWPASAASWPRNVLVDNNTCRNPYRCAYACSYRSDTWALTNNVLDKQSNYVSGVDLEPETSGGGCYRIEVAYNRFLMNNRKGNPRRETDGKAMSRWSVSASVTPGDFIYLHHNYGTYGTGHGPTPWWDQVPNAGGPWGGTLVVTPNGADGSTSPP